MMRQRKHFVRVGLALVFFVFSGFPVWADEKGDFDYEQALEQLHDKKEHEERELNRLSAMVLIPAGEFVMGRNGLSSNEQPAQLKKVWKKCWQGPILFPCTFR